jgi:hypothetical protein
VKDRKIFVNLLILLLILSACARKEAVRQPQLFLPAEKVTIQELVNKIAFLEITTIKSEIKVKIIRNEEPIGSFSGILIYSHPDRLNIRVYGPIGLTFMEVLFVRGTLQVFIPPKDILYSGAVPFDSLLPDRSELMNSKRIIEETEDLYILYILGNEDFENELEKEGEGGFDLTLKAKYFFQKTDLLLDTIEIYRDKKKQVKIDIYRNEGSIPVDIGIHVRNTVFRLEFKDIIINEQIKDDYFKPLKASKTFPLSSFIRDFAPNQ